MSLEEEFEAAAEKAKATHGVSNDDKLKIYSLFKQVKEGPVSQTSHQRPGMFDLYGKAKYDAWAGLGDLSKEQAMKDYIAVVESL